MTIRVHDLSLSYHSGSPAVRGVSFDAAPGRPVSVLGSAGSGKSTLLDALALLTPSASGPRIVGGDASVLDTPIRGLSERDRNALLMRIGVARQGAADRLPGATTVFYAVADPIFSRDPKFSRTEAGVQVASVLDRVQLPMAMMDKHIFELSRGQRQRVLLAQALLLDPHVLLVDDPVAGLDPQVAPEILSLLARLAETATVVSVVRTPAQASHIGGTSVVMHRGAVVGFGDIAEVMRTSDHPWIEALARSARLDVQ